jgi:hypothetical protein
MENQSRPTPGVAFKDHLERIPEGGVAWLTREQLGQSSAEFAATLAALSDLERAGEVRLGGKRKDQAGDIEAIEIERLV